jgi:opacity protein-like surface antigen
MRALFLLTLSAISAFSQPFSFGVKAGVPVTDFLSTVQGPNFGFNSTTNRYIVGPTVELRLPFGLGIELDALYRHLNYTGTSFGIDVATSSSTTGNAWEFPLLAKYRFPSKIVRPYVDAGVAWDTLSGLTQTITQTVFPNRVNTTTTSNPAELNKNTTSGFVIGGGVDVHVLLIHLSPEIRYTRWGAQHFLSSNGGLSSNQNQAEFLLGITF